MKGSDIIGGMPPRLIAFDGICNLCNGLVQFIIIRDPQARFTFTALQSPAGQQLLQENHLPLYELDSFVYLREGVLYRKSAAALHVFRDIGGLWQLLYMFIIVPGPIRDFVYGLIARSRYSIWGKKDSCMIPTPDLRKRFL